MKLVLALLLSLFLFFKGAAQEIVWNKHCKLDWSDFRGQIPEDRGFKEAVSKIRIVMEGNVYEGEVPDVKINAYFIPKNSWTTVNSLETLKHEQLHFDIAEIFAREIRKEFDSLVKRKISDFEIYTKSYNLYLSEYEKYQKLYDSEVYFNKEKQAKWECDVVEKLKKLKDFKIKE